MKAKLLIVLAFGALAADLPKDEAAKKDLEKMQGDWVVVSMIRDGDKVPDDEAQVVFRTVKGDQYTIFRFDKPYGGGTLTLDATKKPRAIDALPASASGKSKPLLGIYEFDGDNFKVCFAPPGADRPTDFSCKKDSGHTLTVWAREKKDKD